MLKCDEEGVPLVIQGIHREKKYYRYYIQTFIPSIVVKLNVSQMEKALEIPFNKWKHHVPELALERRLIEYVEAVLRKRT